jgi:hypothetical protein
MTGYTRLYGQTDFKIAQMAAISGPKPGKVADSATILDNVDLPTSEGGTIL